MEQLTEISFIDKHKNDSLMHVSLLLSKQPTLDKEFILAQINGIQKAKDKIPMFYALPNIIYPIKLSLEQCSSEKTGVYKSRLIKGHSLVDLTGGFGIDSFFFSKEFEQVTYIEQNVELFKTVQHNFDLLNVKNITLVNSTAEKFIKTTNKKFDIAYLDPSRRSQNQRVFKLEECTPNIIDLADKLFEVVDKILIKTAPLLDIKQTLKKLKYVSNSWIVSLNNDCKEVLYLLEKNKLSETQIHTINITKKTQQFNFTYAKESAANIELSEPELFLYEPNSAILKAGAFNIICKRFNVKKIAQHSHLYTANNLVEKFPGRCFKIEHVLSYNLKEFRKLNIIKANVSCRNFKDSVTQVKQKLKLQDGGEVYLFATTDFKGKPILVVCLKLK